MSEMTPKQEWLLAGVLVGVSAMQTLTDPRLRAELEKGAAHGFARSARSRSVDGVRLLSIDGGPWVKVG